MHTEFIKQVSTKPLNGVMQTMLFISVKIEIKPNDDQNNFIWKFKSML